ncbi:hypothetical protein ZEAMMB73_Zm00001d028453 [Zea mays]|uniref:Uncharacterized protein n=1 Tax=Zea mays TaxID=4577 RepID=A0A1D6JWB1_MAIZE|nr:hypothetical protein ZEAMMB73_Zm00001d028453 [Zea mays]
MPTWLLSMSRNSGLRTVSSSTARMWLLGLPLSLMLRSPRYCAPVASERLLLGASTKARPWSLSWACSETMANTKVAENDRRAALLAGPWKKRRGAGKNAWPLVCLSLVRASRPLGVTAAAPSSVRFAPVKPSYANCSALADETSSILRRRKSRRMEMGLTLTMAAVAISVSRADFSNICYSGLWGGNSLFSDRLRH